MKQSDITIYSEQLRELGIEYTVVAHPELKTPPETLRYLGLTLAEGSSTLIMKADDRYIAVVRRDDCKLDFEKVKQAIGAKEIRMATPEEFSGLTGLPVGAARVFNPHIETLLDQRLFEKDYLIGGSGSFTCSFRYKVADLPKIPGSRVVDVISDTKKFENGEVSSEKIKQLEQLLHKANIHYELVPLPEDLPLDVASHAAFHGITMKQAVPTLIFSTEKGLIAVQRRADTNIDFKKLKQVAGVSQVRFASADEVRRLGYEPGIVPIAGLALPHFVDVKVLDNELVYGGSGLKTFALKLRADDVVKANHATVGDLAGSERRRVYSGIRATGRLHLGNYLGAVKGMLSLQDTYECIFSVVDLHAMTTPYDPKTLMDSVRAIVMDYLAAGLDPKKCLLEIQSKIPQHTELSFLLSTFYPVSRLEDLPTYKDKKQQHPRYVNMGLLYYPVLMAADIMLYKAELVPVGIDQEPHLEVTREIARKFNSMFGETFPEPFRFATPGEYVPSLTGSGKMGKSIEGSYISLSDDLETIRQRLAKAPTDSGTAGGDVPREGGVANLFKLLQLFSDEKTYESFASDYREKKIRYVEMKYVLADVIYKEIKPLQERRRQYEENPKLVTEIIEHNSEKCRELAAVTMREVKERMGLL